MTNDKSSGKIEICQKIELENKDTDTDGGSVEIEDEDAHENNSRRFGDNGNSVTNIKKTTSSFGI